MEFKNPGRAKCDVECAEDYVYGYNSLKVSEKNFDLVINSLLKKIDRLLKKGQSSGSYTEEMTVEAGGADTMFVLAKSTRCSSNATLYCSGRDIEDKEIDLRFDKGSCTWDFVADSSANPEMLLPNELQKLIQMMKEISFFSGANEEFAATLQARTGVEMRANMLKRMMNRYRSELEELGVIYESVKRDNKRCIDIVYEPPNNPKTDDQDD